MAILSIPFASVLVAGLLSSVLATDDHQSHHHLTKRFELSSQYATMDLKSYRLANDVWGKDSGSGWQTTMMTKDLDGSAGFYTDFTWTGGDNSVKSYSNLASKQGLNQKLSSISSINCRWSWQFENLQGRLTADVSHDLWLSSTAGCPEASTCSSWEVMIWYGRRGGAGPAGRPDPVQFTYNGVVYDRHIGKIPNNKGGFWNIISYVRPNSQVEYSQTVDFDIKPFLQNMVDTKLITADQYLTNAQAGFEVFTGKGRFQTYDYSLQINAGNGWTPPPPPSSRNNDNNAPAPNTTPSNDGKASLWENCTVRQCQDGLSCVKKEKYYSQCQKPQAWKVKPYGNCAWKGATCEDGTVCRHRNGTKLCVKWNDQHREKKLR